MSRNRKPAYPLHKLSGRARIRIDGKDHDLVPYGSPENRDRFGDLLCE